MSRAEKFGNVRLRETGSSELIVEEVLAGRLYTGPMYEKYNAVLRAKSGNEFLMGKCAKQCKGNLYVTTIHAINSCV